MKEGEVVFHYKDHFGRKQPCTCVHTLAVKQGKFIGKRRYYIEKGIIVPDDNMLMSHTAVQISFLAHLAYLYTSN